MDYLGKGEILANRDVKKLRNKFFTYGTFLWYFISTHETWLVYIFVQYTIIVLQHESNPTMCMPPSCLFRIFSHRLWSNVAGIEGSLSGVPTSVFLWETEVGLKILYPWKPETSAFFRFRGECIDRDRWVSSWHAALWGGTTCLNQWAGKNFNGEDGDVHIVWLLNGAKHFFVLVTKPFLNSNAPPATGHWHFRRCIFGRIENKASIAK